MLIAILGGGGVFGQQLADYLLRDTSDAVLAIGRNPPKADPFTLSIGNGNPRYRYQQIHAVYEQDRLLDTLDKAAPSIIVSFCAQGEGAASWTHSWRFFETNTTAMVRLCEQLRWRPYLNRFIQIGTSELYGSVTSPSKETDPIQPTSPYAISKAAFDQYLLAVCRVQSFPMNIVRPSNAYAPGQQLHRLIPKAVLCGLTGQRVPLHGRGAARKSYIHANDLSAAIRLVMMRAPVGAVYNVGPAEPIAIRALLERLAGHLDLTFDALVREVPEREGQDAQYWLDSSAIRALGWEPSISLDQGLAEMVQWGRTHLPVLRGYSTDYVLRA